MPRPSASIVSWLSATLAVAAPALVLLAILAAARELSWVLAGLGAAAVLLITGLITRRHLKDLAAVLAYAEALAAHQAAPTPYLAGTLPGRLLSAVRRLDRAWQARADALRGSIAINESLLDSLPDPIILLDAGRRVLFSNAAVRQQLGASGIGRDLASLVRDPRVLESASAVLQGAAPREVGFEMVDPAERHFAVRVAPLHEETAGGGTCVIAMVDLTAMKRIEEMRSDFIANASHELRTPLSSLIGFIETLRGPARDDAPAREQFLELMHQQAERMARLVRDLLALSTIEMSEYTPPAGEISLSHLLRGVADALQVQARSRGVQVDLRIPDDLPKIVGDGDQVTQLFQNLVDNAIKYGAADGTVTIEARATTMPLPGGADGDNPAVCVTVADQGDGIPKEHLPRLTERFYRVDAARSRAVGGTGLGLAIVKHIVSRHRGQLRIESEPGQGSRFTVWLPVSEAPRAA
jgi:two-component system phosphate regulon sensor histidine kinase PhoR